MVMETSSATGSAPSSSRMVTATGCSTQVSGALAAPSVLQRAKTAALGPRKASRAGGSDWIHFQVVPNSVVPCPTAGAVVLGYDGSRGASAQPRATTARTGPPTTPRAATSSAWRAWNLGRLGREGRLVISDDSGEHLWYSGFGGDGSASATRSGPAASRLSPDCSGRN